MQIKTKLLYPTAILPKKATRLASGFDLHAYDVMNAWQKSLYKGGPVDDFVSRFVMPGERVFVWTGIAVSLTQNWEGQVRPRSGLALKAGITVVNTPGTIDADYTGEIGVVLLNTSETPFQIRKGDRIAQLVFSPVLHDVELIQGETATNTERGSGGFGHTGIK